MNAHSLVFNLQLTETACSGVFHSNPQRLFAFLVAVQLGQLNSVVRVTENLRVEIADNTLRNLGTVDFLLPSVIFGQLPLCHKVCHHVRTNF